MKYSPDHDCFRTRGVLSRDTIVEIYKLRTNDKKIKTAASASVGLKHGVTAKAIRDIWNRRTWWNVTEALWTEEEREDYARRRKPCGKAGRPRGSKDSKKRRAKIGAGIAYSSWSEGPGLPRPIHMSREELWGEALRHVMR
ncbi:hypothetical protein GUITHDRAFT_122992 [Guillardia theta CCMP2712]|uniref:Uncharacterized protein n=1 Tax=Guillardia theta (strain CCMP2712) TaxID=905079 RepID=L1I430_GUITC|nr:hypothetical protein GUITHDRAFT_122992 [Guillardia theta CCMP2712]EKX30792.1 hypothetical protein GUITHDRAFT_122992 [Guillardia theta CCMP2712]|eukprot:XP_005817772.1 hypothetical protein GUITHDRAFT_122992 [Guillardia theta CCMP2712]